MKKTNVGILNQKMESSKANAYLKEQTISKCHRIIYIKVYCK